MKRSFSTFLIYAKDNVDAVKLTVAKDSKFGEVARVLASNFRSLSDAELKAIGLKVLQDPIRFESTIEGFVHTEEPKRKKAKKDPNAPKRNMSAYFLFSISARPQAKIDNPEASFGELAKILSDQFKGLSEKEKLKWDDAAANDKKRYEKELEEYNKKK